MKCQVTRIECEARKVLESAYVLKIEHVDESIDCGSLIILGFELAVDEAFFWYGGTKSETDIIELLAAIFSDHFIDSVAQLTRE